MTETGAPLWSVGPGRLPRLVGEVRADVCVIGLGGSGLSALARLVAANKRVVGIDARGVAAGAAGRNGGFFLAGPAELHHRLRDRVGPARARALYELTLEARDRLFAETPGADPRGSLRLPASDEEVLDARAHLEALHADGFPAEAAPGPRGGVVIPGDGVFDPGRRARALADRIADRADLHGASPALEIGPETVRTPSGVVRAEAILIAVDGRLERLVPALATATERRPAVRSLRLQMLATAPAHDVRIDRAVYHRFGYDYWQQRPDARIALGGGRDVGGEAEETDELGTTPEVQAHLERLLRDEIGTRAAITHRWSGIVAYTDDGLPLAEGLEAEVGPGVFACGGYSGHGNVLGAMAGEALADLAIGRPLPSLVRWLAEVRSAAARS